MYNICNVLNQIGDFCLRIGEKKLELTGTLIKKDNNVILEARTVKENLKYIREDIITPNQTALKKYAIQ